VDALVQNTLGDLNNHLFMQLERLNDEELDGEKLMQEVHRSKAVTDVASQIISNGALVLKAKVAYDETVEKYASKPRMLEG
jgi:hypothetical protein